jgi:hypothetical protein
VARISVFVENKYGEHADVDDVWTDDDKLIVLRMKVIVRISDDNKLGLGNEGEGKEEEEEKGTSMHHCILPHSIEFFAEEFIDTDER